MGRSGTVIIPKYHDFQMHSFEVQGILCTVLTSQEMTGKYHDFQMHSFELQVILCTVLASQEMTGKRCIWRILLDTFTRTSWRAICHVTPTQHRRPGTDGDRDSQSRLMRHFCTCAFNLLFMHQCTNTPVFNEWRRGIPCHCTLLILYWETL